jgi:hypothetical protein
MADKIQKNQKHAELYIKHEPFTYMKAVTKEKA